MLAFGTHGMHVPVNIRGFLSFFVPYTASMGFRIRTYVGALLLALGCTSLAQGPAQQPWPDVTLTTRDYTGNIPATDRNLHGLAFGKQSCTPHFPLGPPLVPWDLLPKEQLTLTTYGGLEPLSIAEE
jgi:hypothetical protein